MQSISDLKTLLVFLLFHACASAEPWTMDGDKPIPGTFLGLEKGKMVFELGDKRRAALDLSRLSPESLEDLRKWHSGKTSSTALLAPPRWSARDGVRAIAIETKSKGPEKWIFETPHFIFELDAPVDSAAFRKLAMIAEATFNRVNSLPVRIPPAPPEKNRILVFNEQDAYLKAGGNNTSAARFLGNRGNSRGAVIASFESFGLKAPDENRRLATGEASRLLVHEIGHQLVAEAMPFLPTWLNEGFAEYVALVPCTNGVFESSPAQRLAAIRNRIDHYKRMDLEWFGIPPFLESKAGGGKNAGSDLADWLVPLEELLGNPRLIDESLRTGDSLTLHRAYLTSMLLTHYFFHFEGDRQGRNIRAYFETAVDLNEILMRRPPLVTRVKTPKTRSEFDAVIEDMRDDFIGGRTHRGIQDDMVIQYAKAGIPLPFPP